MFQDSRIFKITDTNDPDLIEAAKILREDGVIAFPTETVYGLGASIKSDKGLRKIFEIKGRPADNPLIVHISDREQLEDLVREIPKEAKVLTEKFWPGPLTLILKKKENVSDLITAGLDTVAVRMPSHPIAAKLIDTLGIPIAAPSANISGRPSITREEDLLGELSSKVDGLILGNASPIGIESTVLDLSTNEPKILRPGFIDEAAIERVSGLKLSGKELKGVERPKSPGMKYKHYAPKAEVVMVSGEKRERESKIRSFIKAHPGDKILYIGEPAEIRDLSKKEIGDIDSYMSRFYALLREADREGFKFVLAQKPEEIPANAGLIDRLEHASNYSELK